MSIAFLLYFHLHIRFLLPSIFYVLTRTSILPGRPPLLHLIHQSYAELHEQAMESSARRLKQIKHVCVVLPNTCIIEAHS
jgi:hypothetical protein